jgi:hypothetical protein
MRERNRAIKKMLLHPLHDFTKEHNLQRLAAQISATTSIPHHIDHIIPLAHGGWHHHDNLQILPRNINIKKGKNPFWFMAGFKSWKNVPCSLWPQSLRSEYEKRKNSNE